LGRASDAVAPLLKAVEIDPQDASYEDHLTEALFFRGQQTDIASNFLAAVRSDPASFGNFLEAVKSDTNHFALYNNMAWRFAAFPDASLRNGKYAVRLATRACEITGYKTNYCVGTLAVAYAEDSRFDDAISTAQLACSLASAASQPENLKEYQALLVLFRSHQTYHPAIQ